MKLLSVLALSSLAAAPLFAEGKRSLDAHEHGVGQLDIAFDGQQIAMEFHAPGADLVGFEYAATSSEDRKAVDMAVATLARPLDLFVLPQSAGCSVTQASAELESEAAHSTHDEHDNHAEHDEHDNHAEHDEHDEHAHEHHSEHSEHAHDKHEADDHAASAGHTEFHAEYMLNCADTSAVANISFAYFDTFPNAREVEVQIISESGAQSFTVERTSPVLDLRNLF
ncbi:zinc uptake protein ZrgA [Planktotalea sp.]|uniref:zinc uptake protein ZrgA n=1 Tax=Planktotalea sp. TaxID=2029877 RepID=UPI003D6AB92B